MNSIEAINALFEGKYIRHYTWEDGHYIFMPSGGMPTYSEGRSVKTAAEKLLQINEWEILEYQYQWLCYDVKKEEYFLSDYIVGEMKYALGETRYKVIKRLDETRKVFKF